MYGTENWDTQHSSELPYIVIPTNGIKCVSLCKTNRNMTNSQKIFLKGTTKNEEDTISYSGARHATCDYSMRSNKQQYSKQYSK